MRIRRPGQKDRLLTRAATAAILEFIESEHWKELEWFLEANERSYLNVVLSAKEDHRFHQGSLAGFKACRNILSKAYIRKVSEDERGQADA